MAQAQVTSIAKDTQVEAARIPPQSIEAEQSVLGGLLLDNSAWDRIADLLGEHDFYRADHRLIFQHIGALIEHGKPADTLTVAESLERSGKLGEIGGHAYLASLSLNTPSAANIRRYAEIVRERSVMRHLAAVGTEIAESAFSPGGRTAGELLDHAEGRVFEIAEASSRGRQGFLELDELAARVVTRMDELYHSENANDITGIPTGFTDLDQKTAGLQPGDLIIVAGRPSMGKAQPLDAKVLTKAGWKRMDALKLGDELASVDGRPSRVSGIFPQGRRQVYRITFSDGRSTECCGEHLWRINYRDWEAPRVLQTKDISRLLRRVRYRNRLFIETYAGEYGHAQPLPIDPWLVGILLGDGALTGSSVRFATADVELLPRVKTAVGQDFAISHAGSYNYRIIQAGGAHRKGVSGVNPNAIKEELSQLKLWGRTSEDKFIPRVYLDAPRRARIELLRGLLDTDGWIERWGTIRFCTVSERLAQDVVELVRSLGGSGSYVGKQPHYSYRSERRQGQIAYVCNLQHPEPRRLFTLDRKLSRAPAARTRQRRLNVESIEPTRVIETQCVAVTHPDHLYITDDYIVTHNTALALNIAEHVGIDYGLPVAVYSMEMSGEQVAMRMLGSIARVSQHKIRTGRVEENDWANVTAGLGKLQNANIYIDESGALNPLELRARARRLYRQCGKLGLVVVDYLQLMSASRSDNENRATELSEISRSLKALAKELHVPIVALSQLNRGVESRTDRRPLMSDLRESGALEQDADLILFIYRDEVYRPDSPDKGLAEIIIGKQRNGPIGTVKLTFRGEFTRFENYANPDRF
ncbi:MAG: replicative DNA helicase [Burkholderiales bacterium]